MNQLLEFFQKLFDTADWPPRWHCGNWTEAHGWFYIISDLLIWSAYFAIPLVILKYISKRIKTRFIRLYFLFAAFILACGTTHLLDAAAFWFPAYRLGALVRFITGVVSWITVFYLFRILPGASQLRTHEDLEKEISDRRKVEDQLKLTIDQLNIAQGIAKIGHWQWDVLSNEIFWSEQLFQIYDTPRDTALNFEMFLAKIHPEEREMVAENIQRAFTEKVFKPFIHRILLDDGTEKILQARGDVILDESGNVIKMIGTGQDITEVQKAQQELLDRTNQLETSNAELQKFAYVASHDLQEPLRKIQTFSSLLGQELEHSITEKGKSYMNKVIHSADRMKRLIDDILQFSSLRSSKNQYEKVNLSELIENVLSDMEVVIGQTGAVIKVGVLPEFDMIPSQIGQLFQNLISNGVKFTKPGVPPLIEFRGEVRSGAELMKLFADPALEHALAQHYNWERQNFVAIQVTDNGIGFDEAYKEKIFEIFQRLQTERVYEGTGIGLAICKRIVENHKGYISARSAEGEGATFIIVLPVHQKGYNWSKN